MSKIETLAAPEIPTPPIDKWEREKLAFHHLLPSLLNTHKGLFVAIHEGQVVESGNDKLDVGGRAYARFGYVPIFVSLVTEHSPLIRFPSPRTCGAGKDA